jgi:hypothetical protein
MIEITPLFEELRQETKRLLENRATFAKLTMLPSDNRKEGSSPSKDEVTHSSVGAQ